MSKGSKVVFVAFTQHCIQSNVTHLAHVKGSKEALTVLIVTYVTHVKRVESGVCGLCTQDRYIQCYVERVERLCYVETRDKHIFAHNFLNIQPIFNPTKSFGKLRLRPFQPYHPMLCMSKGSKVILTFNPFNMLRHT